MSNSIGSLRFLSAMDWREFVEQMSAVERTLREDPAGVYGRMSFATRDRYRHVVEEIAKKSGVAESDVALAAIGLAGEYVAGTDGDDRARHVGYYLIDEGLPKLEARVRVRSSVADMVRSIGRRFALPVYLGSILLLVLVFAAGMVAETGYHGTWLPALDRRRALALPGKLARHRTGQPFHDTPCHAPSAAANGLLQGNSSGIVHPGRGPHHADEP